MNIGFNHMGGGFDPAAMSQKLTERFNSADADGSGSVTKTEILDNAEGQVDSQRLDKMFERADSNGDGEITQEEHEAMLSKMQERFENMKQNKGIGYPQSQADTFDSLLKSLSGEKDEEGKKSAYSQALEKANGDPSKLDSNTVKSLFDLAPPVDTFA